MSWLEGQLWAGAGQRGGCCKLPGWDGWRLSLLHGTCGLEVIWQPSLLHSGTSHNPKEGCLAPRPCSAQIPAMPSGLMGRQMVLACSVPSESSASLQGFCVAPWGLAMALWLL